MGRRDSLSISLTWASLQWGAFLPTIPRRYQPLGDVSTSSPPAPSQLHAFLPPPSPPLPAPSVACLSPPFPAPPPPIVPVPYLQRRPIEAVDGVDVCRLRQQPDRHTVTPLRSRQVPVQQGERMGCVGQQSAQNAECKCRLGQGDQGMEGEAVRVRTKR